MKVYLDYAATTMTAPEVVNAMTPYFTNKYGNPSSLHKFGQEANEAMESAREKIAKFINAEPKEIVFTSGGTESDNLAIQEAAYPNKNKGNHIITSKIEHHAVDNTCKFLEKDGFRVTYLDVDKQGIADIEQLKQSITKETILVTIMHANNEIGTIQPIEEIGKICREKGVYFHTDAVQSIGKIPIDVKKMNIDLLSCSAHKFHGPKGVGFLYVRKGVKIHPLMHGGNHEHGLRAGTENVAGVVGMAKAIELCEGFKEIKEEIKLRDKLIKRVLKEIPDTTLNGHPTKRSPGNAHFSFKYVEGESVLLHLDDNGIAVSTGSACSSHELKPSHVLTAIGLRPEEAHGSIRISLGRYTTDKEIEYTIKILKKVISNLRKISPFGRGD